MNPPNKTVVLVVLCLLVLLAFLYYYAESINCRFIGRPTKVTPASHQIFETQRYILAHTIGGIGNQMWIYATLYGLAKKSHRIPLACVSYNMSVLFPSLSIPLYPNDMCNKGSKLRPNTTQSLGQAHSAIYFDTELLQRLLEAKSSHVHISAYLQNLGFFVEYLQEIKNEFALHPFYKNKANIYLKQQFETYKRNRTRDADKHVWDINSNFVFIGVHARMTGFKYEGGIMQPTVSFFNKAMSYFRNKFNNRVLFIVASDDLMWCHKNIKGSDVIFTRDSGKKSREEDFSIIATCNHTIVSSGTFGWWMAFVSNGEVVAFRDWVGTSKFQKWYLPRQRYPYRWKLM